MILFVVYSLRHFLNFSLALRFNDIYRRDTCFDAHLFRRLFCLYHVMLCARSDDVTACFLFVNNIVLHCQEKTNV